DAVDQVCIKGKAVDQGVVETGLAACSDVLGIGLDDRIGVGDQRIGGGEQQVVLLLGGEHDPASLLGLGRLLKHFFALSLTLWGKVIDLVAHHASFVVGKILGLPWRAKGLV